MRLAFQARDRTVAECDLIADTGCPVGVILPEDLFHRLLFREIPDIDTNFGLLVGGWLRLYMPNFGLVELIRGYGSDTVADSSAREHPAFVGLVGLPVLRLGDYGGDADTFWFRYQPGSP